jgi:hypothetical protein
MKYLEERIQLTNYEAYITYTKKAFNVDLSEAVDKFAKDSGIKEDTFYDDRFFDIFLENMYTKPVMDRLKSYLPQGSYESEMKSLRSYIFHIYNFGKEKQIYRFQQGITQKLIDTDIRKVDGYFLRVPSKSIYLSIPYNTEIKIHNPHMGTFDVKGIYVYMEDIISNVYLDRLYTIEDNARIIKFLAIGGNPTNFEKQINFYATVVIKEGEDVFKTIKEHMSKYMMEGHQTNIPFVEALFKFVCNALLYINSSNPDINPVRAMYNRKAKTPREMAQDVSHSKINFKSVGNSITIDRSYLNNPKEGNNKYDIKTLHWTVRPHWRNQAHGKDRKDRKIIWIERFQKGTDLGAELNKKDYDVK